MDGSEESRDEDNSDDGGGFCNTEDRNSRDRINNVHFDVKVVEVVVVVGGEVR